MAKNQYSPLQIKRKMKIFNIATYKRIPTLLRTIESIYCQADKINIAFNSIEDIPNQLIDSKINIIRTDNSLGAAYKFLFLKDENGYYFTIDDDIIYPIDYADYTISKIERYKRKAIITYHGTVYLKTPPENYRENLVNLHFCQKLRNDTQVDIGGTGVMCFHTDLVKIGLDYFEVKNTVDYWLGIYAAENNIPVICAKRNRGWIQQQEIDKTTTIWTQNNEQSKIKIITDILKKRFPAQKWQNKSPDKMKISIVITAYQSQDFLETCLNSIKEQTYLKNKNNEVEVLLGIDGCPDTLKKINELRGNYNFLKIFYSDINVGTYTLRNSLVHKASSENILFFDSDDFMQPIMLDTLAPCFNKYQITRYCFDKVSKENNKFVVNTKFRKNPFYAMGSFAISKKLFMETGGFLPWVCAADYEFMIRCEKNNIPFHYLKKNLFFYLVHNNNLTRGKNTGMVSFKRNKYHRYIQRNTNWNIPIHTCTTNLIDI